MKLAFLSATMLALLAPAGAQAAVTFNGVCANTATTTQAKCSTALTGTYGNSATIYGVDDATLGVKITAWQGNQTASQGKYAISNAFLGAYSGGFGVTGKGDSSGDNNLHQIDNAGGYTDFVLLQFNRAVHLEGVNVNYYGLSSGFDSDASFFNASGILKNTSGESITASNWASAIDLANGSYSLDPTLSGWATTSSTPDNATSQGSAYRANTASGFSQVWLVSAAVLTDRDDGFKLSRIMVTPQTPAVPEPATWGMMIVGFGAIGAAMRRRRTAGAAIAA